MQLLRSILLLVPLSLSSCSLFGYGSQVIDHGHHRYTVTTAGGYEYPTLKAAKNKARSVCHDVNQTYEPQYVNIKTNAQDLSQQTIKQILAVKAFDQSKPYQKASKADHARNASKVYGDFTVVLDFKCVPEADRAI